MMAMASGQCVGAELDNAMLSGRGAAGLPCNDVCCRVSYLAIRVLDSSYGPC